jgi:hypothetical protein
MKMLSNQKFLAIDAGQEGKNKFSQITITDQGNYPVEEKRRAWASNNLLPADQQDAAGTPALEFLDETGRVVRAMP